MSPRMGLVARVRHSCSKDCTNDEEAGMLAMAAIHTTARRNATTVAKKRL